MENDVWFGFSFDHYDFCLFGYSPWLKKKKKMPVPTLPIKSDKSEVLCKFTSPARCSPFPLPRLYQKNENVSHAHRVRVYLFYREL